MDVSACVLSVVPVQAEAALHRNLNAPTVSRPPSASTINRRRMKKNGKQAAPEVPKKAPDMNGIVLSGRFRQTLALFITCHLTPATLCLCKAIKQVSEADQGAVNTKQTPCVILYLQILGEVEWGNAAPLTWCVHMQVNAFRLSRAHMHAQGYVQTHTHKS